jgi:hypothetical protein
MGKLTISLAIFNSYVKLPEDIPQIHWLLKKIDHIFPLKNRKSHHLAGWIVVWLVWHAENLENLWKLPVEHTEKPEIHSIPKLENAKQWISGVPVPPIIEQSHIDCESVHLCETLSVGRCRSNL